MPIHEKPEIDKPENAQSHQEQLAAEQVRIAPGRPRNAKYGDVPTQADYQTTRNEFTETLKRLKDTNSFSTSKTVTPEIAKKQGEAWLDYLDKKAEKPEGQVR